MKGENKFRLEHEVAMLKGFDKVNLKAMEHYSDNEKEQIVKQIKKDFSYRSPKHSEIFLSGGIAWEREKGSFDSSLVKES